LLISFQAHWVRPALSIASGIDSALLVSRGILANIGELFSTSSDKRISGELDCPVNGCAPAHTTFKSALAVYLREQFMIERVFRSENLRTGFSHFNCCFKFVVYPNSAPKLFVLTQIHSMIYVVSCPSLDQGALHHIRFFCV
jgi:hypothetical protein